MHFLCGYAGIASTLRQRHTTHRLFVLSRKNMKLNAVCYALLGLALIASLFFLHPIWMWWLLANLLKLLVYGVDKLAARKGWRRVHEITLWVFGLVGGWIGAIVAQQLFRHKTQKQPFKSWFIVSVVLNVVATLAIWYWVYGRWIL